MKRTNSELATIAAVAQLLAVVLTVAALFFARDVFIPLSLGLLLSFLLSPIVNRLQRIGVPNLAAVVATATIAFVLLAGGFTLLGRELTTLVGDLPKHKDELVEKARSFAGLTTGMGGTLNELADEVSEAMEAEPESANAAASKTPPIDEQATADLLPESDSASYATMFQRWTDKVFPAEKTTAETNPNDGSSPKSPLYIQPVKDDLPLATWATTAGTVLGPLATAGLVTVFALFMLIHREDLRDRIIAVISHGDYVTTTEALDEVGNRISRYLIAQTAINTSYGIVLAIGLSVIGITMTEDGAFPNAVLWGVMATCLRFVPYIGPTAAAIFPLAIALSVFPGYSVFIAVLALIVTMELFSNNVVEPWLYGTSTGISAVAVIVAAVFWGWLWGPVGLLLSTPLTVCLVVLGRHVPRFRVMATLLGEEVDISPSLRFYQRLLVGDQHRAAELLNTQLAESTFGQTCDDVLVPVMKRIRKDHNAERLSDADANRLFALTGGLIDKLQKQHASEADDSDNEDSIDNPPSVVGCASHHFSESLVLNLLRYGGKGTYQLNSVDDESLPQEVGKHVADLSPAVVVIVVLPKGGTPQASFLCRTIRGEGYRGPIIIACLGKFKNFDTLFVKFRKAGATSVTTSYSQTRAKIESFVLRQNSATRSQTTLIA
ncbi:putative PurR-regulated permease PerM [Rhodopirellula rubra]|uniref:Putative PurR-regulated permease PerM n=1 Tax=Aporhodopirellula rubra TaxID=980271 RepID=A0A7W5DYD9_9BACT|nr:AI-2E family transporter [Aporhodopirellula rubra]MBB3206801.1 putative PurR-regulated permease PerM [Aporhodopirellula rubra]